MMTHQADQVPCAYHYDHDVMLTIPLLFALKPIPSLHWQSTQPRQWCIQLWAHQPPGRHMYRHMQSRLLWQRECNLRP
jgi:hypothetical protein